MAKFLLFIISFVSLPTAAAGDVKTCWDTLHTLSLGMSDDYACVLDKAKAELNLLCSADGIRHSKALKMYLSYKAEYEAAKAEVSAWIKENPGAPRMSLTLSTKLHRAETDWMLFGTRYEIDDLIEKVRRQSAECIKPKS